MLTKQEFDLAAHNARANLGLVLPMMVRYKSSIQRAVLNQVTQKELEDIRDSRINYGMIDKLCRIAKNEWIVSHDAQSLYCAAMAVATIVKEYDWGSRYLVGYGLWEMAQSIQNA